MSDRVIRLDSCADRAAIRLQYGWVVERFLRDGDHVIFNLNLQLSTLNSSTGSPQALAPPDGGWA
eukprot:scaffold960_cov24-Tisochrysis_lutea.AAC.2